MKTSSELIELLTNSQPVTPRQAWDTVVEIRVLVRALADSLELSNLNAAQWAHLQGEVDQLDDLTARLNRVIHAQSTREQY